MIFEHIKKNSSIYLILFFAFLLRSIYLISYCNLPDWDLLTVDNYYHHNLAVSIAGGNIFGDTTYFRAPFYIYCLALLYKVFGVSWWVGRIFGLFTGLLSIFFTYKISERVFNKKIGYIAAILQSLYPIIIYFESELLLDPLFMLLLQVSVYFFIRWWDVPSIKNIFLTGIFLGLSAITRPTALVLVPLVVLMILVILKDKKIKQLLLFIVGCVLIISPISIRNYVVEQDPVLIASQGGINFYIGNNESADGLSAVLPEPLGFNWRINQVNLIAERELGKKLKPGELSSYWFGKGLDWIQENPVDFLSLYIKKLYYNFSNVEISNNRNIPEFFSRVFFLKYNPLSFGIIFAMAIISVFLTIRTNQKALFLCILIILYIMASSLFFFNSRFRLPLLPFYLMLASYTLSVIWGNLFINLKASIKLIILTLLVSLFSYYTIAAQRPGAQVYHLISKGINYLSMEQYPKALEKFYEAREVDSTFPEINLNIGVCYFKTGQEDSALYYFDQEIVHNPQRTKAHNNIASIYLLNGEYEAAIRELERPLENRPFDLITNQILLRAVFFSENYSMDEINTIINDIALRTNNNPSLLNEAATFLSNNREYQLAEKLLFKSLLSDNHPIETNDFAFQRNFNSDAFNSTKDRAQAYYLLGFIKGLQKAFGQSIEFNNRAIALDPGNSKAYINLISAYLSTNQRAKARETFKLAQAKFPDDQYLIQMQQHIK